MAVKGTANGKGKNALQVMNEWRHLIQSIARNMLQLSGQCDCSMKIRMPFSWVKATNCQVSALCYGWEKANCSVAQAWNRHRKYKKQMKKKKNDNSSCSSSDRTWRRVMGEAPLITGSAVICGCTADGKWADGTAIRTLSYARHDSRDSGGSLWPSWLMGIKRRKKKTQELLSLFMNHN